MTPVELGTGALAALGSILGVWNTWGGIRDRRTSLRVAPAWSLAIESEFIGLSVTVTNLSTFPVTVGEVGLTVGPGRSNSPRRMPFQPALIVQGPDLPVRLERGEAFTITIDMGGVRAQDFRAAYAITSDGRIFRGKSEALRQAIKMLQEVAAKHAAPA